MENWSCHSLVVLLRFLQLMKWSKFASNLGLNEICVLPYACEVGVVMPSTLEEAPTKLVWVVESEHGNHRCGPYISSLVKVDLK